MMTQQPDDLKCTVHRLEEQRSKSEGRARAVTLVTFAMMIAELVVGTMTKSLALTADGWHMATHVGALGLTALAYWYARTRASQAEFAFGTGRVYALAGFTSALLLGVAGVALLITVVERLTTPEIVDFGDAFPVAVLGLGVNLVCALLLAPHEHHHADGTAHRDHNLRAAYLHVLADALTSVAAIAALLCGRYLGWVWMDACAAALGAMFILRWALGLAIEAGRQLVDLDPSMKLRDDVRASLESITETRVTDLHLWRVGPQQLVCVAAVSSAVPQPLSAYKKAVLNAAPVSHLTIEIQQALS